MEILIHERLAMQLKDKHTSDEVKRKIKDDISTLKDQEQKNCMAQYLKNQNSKKMKGARGVFKFRLSSGDRILYTYSSSSQSKEKDLLLLSYTHHDEQGKLAKKYNPAREHESMDVTQILGGGANLDIDSLQREGFLTDEIDVFAKYISGAYDDKHSSYVKSDDDLHDAAQERSPYVLSDEQDTFLIEFAKCPQPTLVQGGAGCGKTVVAIHLLHNFVSPNNDKRACYFTQSSELLKKAEQQYRSIHNEDTSDPTIEFLDINRFCLDTLKKYETYFVQAHQFYQFIEARPNLLQKCEQADISKVDIWSEIRGTLKGAMHFDGESGWYRALPLDQRHVDGNIESLVKNGYFQRLKEDPQLFRFKDSIANTIQRIEKDETLSEAEKKLLLRARKHFCELDPDARVLSKEEYRNLPDEYSMINGDKRDIIWDVCLEYENYLQQNGLYDENDLVREMFRHQDKFPKYDLVIVDEIQDYTELQIYLLSQICRNDQEIVLAGDAHQIINPTMFRDSRLKDLFYNAQLTKGLKQVMLRKNFRCRQHIVETANNLSQLRIKTIGSMSKKTELDEISILEGGRSRRLAYTEETVLQVLQEIMKYPDAVMLVPNETFRSELLQRLQHHTNDTTASPLIFTVPEIKGMEYKLVICYNLIDEYCDIWRRMLTQNNPSCQTKHQTRYRYYFNLLYVAITRAQDFLVFIDKSSPPELDDRLGLETVNSFNSQALGFDSLENSDEAKLRRAQELYENGNYLVARHFYEELHKKVDVWRCEKSLCRENHDFSAAIKYALLTGDIKEALQMSKEPGVDKSLVDLLRRLSESENSSVGTNRKKTSVLIRECFCDFAEEDQDIVVLSALKTAGTRLRKEIDVLVKGV